VLSCLVQRQRAVAIKRCDQSEDVGRLRKKRLTDRVARYWKRIRERIIDATGMIFEARRNVANCREQKNRRIDGYKSREVV